MLLHAVLTLLGYSIAVLRMLAGRDCMMVIVIPVMAMIMMMMVMVLVESRLSIPQFQVHNHLSPYIFVLMGYNRNQVCGCLLYKERNVWGRHYRGRRGYGRKGGLVEVIIIGDKVLGRMVVRGGGGGGVFSRVEWRERKLLVKS